jgi:hypothetical protein
MTITINPGMLFPVDGTVSEPVVNDGTIFSSGTLSFADAVSGTGLIAFDPTTPVAVTFAGPVGAGQSVDLVDGAYTLDDVADFRATFVAGDPEGGELLLPGLSALTTRIGWNAATQSITIDSGSLHQSIHVLGGGSYGLIVQDFSHAYASAHYSFFRAPSLACFLRGTCLAAPEGAVAVEHLAPGARLLTASGEVRAAVWVGHRPRPEGAEPPVRIRAHAFGPGLPGRDLFLSPDHALFLEGALVPVKHLLHGDAIRPAPEIESPDYFHVALATHDILLAEGLPAESYLDIGLSGAPTDPDSTSATHPAAETARIAALREATACAPYLVAGPRLTQLRTRLATRAA